MRTEQSIWTSYTGWSRTEHSSPLGKSAQLALVFGGIEELKTSGCVDALRAAYPAARICGCTTSGEVLGNQVHDDSVVVTAVSFDHTDIEIARVEIEDPSLSFEAGRELANRLPQAGLRHVFVLGDGLRTVKSPLVAGMTSVIAAGVTLSGGFASDKIRFHKTHVWCDGVPEEATVIAIGFYGDGLRVGVAAAGGWDAFGPERLVTRSTGNVIYEFDGCRALDLYRNYLGPYAAGLPASGLMFPLQIRDGHGGGLLRALQVIDDAEGSLTVGGDVPEGSFARLMTGSAAHLIDGARLAAARSVGQIGNRVPELAILVSCCGRRPVLKHRVDEEADAVAQVLGSQAAVTGFYSFGEVAPIGLCGSAVLHNQTAAVVCFAEE